MSGPAHSAGHEHGHGHGHDHGHGHGVPAEYVIGHVQEALGSDTRVGEWGLRVVVTGNVLTVLGTVATPARKAAVTAVAREAVAALGGDHEVRDATDVAPARPPEGEEELS